MAISELLELPKSHREGVGRFNVVAALIMLVGIAVAGWVWKATGSPMAAAAAIVVGLISMQSPRIAHQWERGVMLRLGRFVGLRGPGLFWIVPFLDRVSAWIDQRTITTSCAAEQTLTSDTVPVNVDAVLFWMVHDVERAALEVQDYENAVSWAAQTALRDIIGRTTLTDLLRGRERIETELQQLIDQRSNPWGVTVSSVEMRDVVIPDALQDAMSREAQAAREKQARVILGEAEMAIANSFQEAAKAYQDNPTALHLRAMNMLYEGLKEGGAHAGPEQRGGIDGPGRADGGCGARSVQPGWWGRGPDRCQATEVRKGPPPGGSRRHGGGGGPAEAGGSCRKTDLRAGRLSAGRGADPGLHSPRRRVAQLVKSACLASRRSPFEPGIAHHLRRPAMEAGLKHLEFIQGVVDRLAGNSFCLEGWAVPSTSRWPSPWPWRCTSADSRTGWAAALPRVTKVLQRETGERRLKVNSQFGPGAPLEVTP